MEMVPFQDLSYIKLNHPLENACFDPKSVALNFVKRNINEVVAKRLGQVPVPVLQAEDYLQRILTFSGNTEEEAVDYEEFCLSFVNENLPSSPSVLASIWVDSGRFYEYFKDEINPLIDDLVDYQLLERSRETIDKQAFLSLLSKDIFSRIEKERDDLFKADVENMEDELGLLITTEDRDKFLYSEHQSRFASLKECAEYALYREEGEPVHEIYYDGWEPKTWRYFTPKYAFQVLCDTINRMYSSGQESAFELDFNLCGGVVGELLIDRFVAGTADWLILNWIKQKINGRDRTSAPEVDVDKEERDLANPVIGSFEGLFRNNEEVPTWVNAFRIVGKKKNRLIINDDGGWVGGKGNLSILVAWIDVLKERNKFYNDPPIENKVLFPLLNAHFPGLKLAEKDNSIFRKNTYIRQEYYADFLSVIR